MIKAQTISGLILVQLEREHGISFNDGVEKRIAGCPVMLRLVFDTAAVRGDQAR